MVNYHLRDIPHTVEAVYTGQVPFDFPPSSLVGDGFISLGNSAFQNKPFNGEGMGAGMEAADIAIPIIIKAIKQSDVSRMALWPYNVKYFRTIGADFAMIRGAGETLVELTPLEFDWMYRAEFLTAQDMFSTFLNYKVQKGFGSLLKSFFHGFSNWKLFMKILQGLKLGMTLHKHYLNYPTDPSKLNVWESKFTRFIKT